MAQTKLSQLGSPNLLKLVVSPVKLRSMTFWLLLVSTNLLIRTLVRLGPLSRLLILQGLVALFLRALNECGLAILWFLPIQKPIG